MPKDPKGEKRPAEVIGAAILVGRISTGDAEDKPSKAPYRVKGGKIDMQIKHMLCKENYRATNCPNNR